MNMVLRQNCVVMCKSAIARVCFVHISYVYMYSIHMYICRICSDSSCVFRVHMYICTVQICIYVGYTYPTYIHMYTPPDPINDLCSLTGE